MTWISVIFIFSVPALVIACDSYESEIFNNNFTFIRRPPIEEAPLALFGSGSALVDVVGPQTFVFRLSGSQTFRLLSLCLSTTSERLNVLIYYDGVKSISKNIGDFSAFCLETLDSSRQINHVVIKFPVTSVFNVSNILLQGCTGTKPEKLCGTSIYADAGIEGGTIPDVTIVNGWRARPNEFPWMVFLHLQGFQCGAAIIDPRYILTAAHCVSDQTVDTVNAFVGVHSLSELSNGVLVNIEEIIIHRCHDQDLYADIALLRLTDPIVFTDTIRPVCLPTLPQHRLVGSKLVVSGWGFTSTNGPSSNHLRYVTLPVMDQDACDECFSDISAPGDILDGMLCAGQCGQNTRDSCFGDSGSPLTRKTDDGSWELVALVSWGIDCASYTPGVNTDVYAYMPWIYANTPERSLDFYNNLP